MRLIVTDAAAQPPRQATAWLIMTLGRRNPNMNEQRPHPLTRAGKILFLVTILLFGFGMFILFTDVFTHLPPGSYPVFVLLGPLVLSCLALFYGGGAFLKKTGRPVFTADVTTEIKRPENEK